MNDVRKKDTFISDLLLSLISVHPDFFRKGIARAMVMEAFRIAINMGFTAVFLCGNPDFYHKFGFNPSYEYGIFHITDKTKEAEWCMALELIPGSLADKEGTINIQ